MVSAGSAFEAALNSAIALSPKSELSSFAQLPSRNASLKAVSTVSHAMMSESGVESRCTAGRESCCATNLQEERSRKISTGRTAVRSSVDRLRLTAHSLSCRVQPSPSGTSRF